MMMMMIIIIVLNNNRSSNDNDNDNDIIVKTYLYRMAASVLRKKTAINAGLVKKEKLTLLHRKIEVALKLNQGSRAFFHTCTSSF